MGMPNQVALPPLMACSSSSSNSKWDVQTHIDMT
jgi:hypothetical protein